MELLPDEVYAINRARLAVALHKTPDEIENAALDGMWDVLGTLEFDAEQERKRAEKLNV